MKLISYRTQAGQPVGGWMGSAWKSGAWPAALLFCLSTFAISSFRASLNPDAVFDLLEPKRIALIVAGAGVFWLAVKQAERHRPDLCGLGRMATVALPGMAVLFGIAVGWDVLIDPEPADIAARNLRWILLWGGYFGTGIAAWLAIHFATALADVQAMQTAEAARASGEDQGFWVKTGRQTIRIPHESVEWVQAEGNYVRIHGADGAHGLIRSTLSAIEAAMGGDAFLRVHRSALCRRSAIRGYRRKPSGAMLALLASGAEAPLGRSYARDVIGSERGALPAISNMDDTVSPAGAEAASA